MQRTSHLTALVALAALALATPAAAQEWGTLKGKIIIEGKLPEMQKIAVNKDPAVCGITMLMTEQLVVGKEGGLANVVIYPIADPKDRAAGWKKPLAKVHPDYAKKKAEPVVLDNKNCRFAPRIVTVWAGQQFSIKNSDPAILHNSFGSPFENSAFNVSIPAGGSIDVKLDKPEKTPFPVACTIHPWMKTNVIVRPDPYVAATNENGEFVIENLPAGELTFQFWQESFGFLKTVTINGKKLDSRTYQHAITIKPGENDLGKIVINAKDDYYDKKLTALRKQLK